MRTGPAPLIQAYLKRRAELGLDCTDEAPVMLDEQGGEIARDQLESYMIQARTVRVSLEANGSLCSAILDARIAAQGQPELFHIVS